MSAVVGLVRSRLRSKSRRERSIDGVDVVVDDGNGLVRYRSLRQQALADPMDDRSALNSDTTHPRTPNELDPASLAEGLQGITLDPDAAPVPPLPSNLSSESFPARRSSLQYKSPYSISAHRRTLSQAQSDASNPVDPTPAVPRRRHYTISSPNEIAQTEGVDYFQSVPRHLSQLEPHEHLSEAIDSAGPAKPTTRTAKLFGRIAGKRRSLEMLQEPGHQSRQSSQTFSQPSSDDGPASGQSTQSPTQISVPKYTHSDGQHSFMPDEVKKPAPLNARDKATPNVSVPEHVRLPAGFELANNEQTIVDTVWHPAVEQQTIYRDRTEILHPMVERDIHVHHYFEYEQPVSVTEVLAPQHYQIDPSTGTKVEIPPPPGWQLPQSMAVTRPDTSQLKGTQRHYLVDEDFPNGKLEAWSQAEQEAATTWI